MWPWTMALAAVGLWLIFAGVGASSDRIGRVQASWGSPSTTIALAEGEAPEETTPVPTTHHRRTPVTRPHRTLASLATAPPVKPFPAELARAKLLLKEDTWIYAQPSNRSGAHAPAGAEKGFSATGDGTTHYFLRVKVESGGAGLRAGRSGPRSTTPA